MPTTFKIFLITLAALAVTIAGFSILNHFVPSIKRERPPKVSKVFEDDVAICYQHYYTGSISCLPKVTR